jgi:glutamate-1-semialdehyde 2,1-aminomutase
VSGRGSRRGATIPPPRLGGDDTARSAALFARAQKVIPGGVNSPVRACRSVGGDPLFIAQGDGPYVYTVDGQCLIDLIGSWGPLVLGHGDAEVLAAVQEVMADGTSFGAPTELEVRFAETICAAMPSIEKVRAVSSGTEATMSAIRLARGFTGRSKIVKIDGGYHGHADFLLVAAGSGLATQGIPDSAGVPKATTADTISIELNDLAAAERVFAKDGKDIACLIVEPVAGNMGCVAPADGYLAGLRELTAKHGALLILDEVMTGFRVAHGGAQARYGVKPDLTCLGKIVGGGLPAAAYGGRADIMDRVAPLGDVYQAGTLSGNPLAMAAGLKTLEILARPGTYERLEVLGARLERGLLKAAEKAGVPACVNRVGSMLTLFFCPGPVTDYAGAKASDTKRFAAYFRSMRTSGVFLPPSQFEAMFVSLAHTEAEIDDVVDRAQAALAGLADH